jgi:hypothetical protein
MKTIDLTQITFKPSLAGQPKTVDFHKDVAEIIYRSAVTLARDSFAHRLFESDGKIEASDEEVGFIREAAQSFIWDAQKEILKRIE